MSQHPEQDPSLPKDASLLEEDSPLYQPPAQAEETDALDAAVDGTSALHYGANDPALYEDQPATDED
ncbi:hypothetical protein [Deinococcus arenicola]|uniref:Uncharacterized protein n=1 Tax=Deinococcus arenicola TaxID=2994950 RepID=A0ABU4DV52_9DEIO|nr:hypothetical protein [Deinococcus sp. ZS9-10]MDV6376311.1 hypothetical protein [Deinococcus sp. ZS9-10]